MKNLIRKILKESEFDWVQSHEPSEDEIVQYIRDNDIKVWNFGEHFEGDLDLSETSIEDLGNLKTVGGYLDLYGTQIEDLGNLESVGGHLYLGTPIKNLGNLESVGGDLSLYGTPISRKYSEEQIRKIVNVNGEVYL